MKKFSMMCLGACVLWSAGAAERTVGNVYVDLDASRISAMAGSAVATWANAGTMGDFKSFGAGPAYQLRGSVPVVRFDGTAASCMTNCVKGEVPGALLGNNPWTMEAWIFCEALTGTHTYLSWTARGSSGTVCEFRYTKDGVSNAVEHYGADYNLQWGAALPAVGEWHHVVCVRTAGSIERLYLDGKQVWTNNNTLNLGSDGPIMLGGVFDRSNYNAPTYMFKGDIARLRIMDGALAPADVYANYVDNYAAFGRVKSDQDAVAVNGAWLDGIQPAAGRGLAIASGAVTFTDFQGTLPYLRLIGGKVTFDGATDLVVNNTRAEKFFDEYGFAGELELVSGRIDFKNQTHFGMGGPNGTFKMTVGGTDAPAVIHGALETGFGHNTPGTVSELNLLRNSVITNDSGWVRLGAGVGTTCVLTVAEGALVDAAQILIGGWGGLCHATVAGTMRSRNSLMGIGEASDTVLTLEPTGVLAARGFCEWNNTTKWGTSVGLSHLHVKGGTLKLDPVAVYAEATPFLNTTMLVTYENGMTVDVPLNGSTYIKAAITNVTASGTSRFVKKGYGTLFIKAPVEGLTGDIHVDEGLLTFNQKFPVDADVRIHVAKGACVSCDVNGGAASSLLPFITADSEGALGVHGYDKNENLDLSDHPHLAVRFLGTRDYVGHITPCANHYIFESCGNGVEGCYPTAIADAGGVPARVTVRAIPQVANNSPVKLAGDNSGMTGGVIVEDGAQLWLAHAFAAGSSGAVKLGEGTSLCLSAAVGSNFLAVRVTDDSRPDQIFIQAGAETVNVDLARFPGCHLGTSGSVSVAQTGTVTPDGDEYVLGGGATPHASSYYGLQPGVLRDRDAETPTAVVIDRDGMINLSNSANTYSGGTVVTNGARVYIQADGLGAIPETFDAKNLYVNGGVVRTGQASFSVNENRGIWVDALGATFHPWGSYTCTYLGGLGGTGAITVTDGGHLTFAGAHNTYAGKITLNNASSIMTIGGGDTFSWSTGEIATGGSVVLNTNGEGSFTGLVSGAGQLQKSGAGTVTVERAQTFTGVTTINGGTLALGDGGAIASTSKIVNNGTLEVTRTGNISAVLGSAPVYGSGTMKVTADGTSVTVDRNVGSAMEISAKNGATVAYLSPGANGGAKVDVDGATLKVGTTANGRVGDQMGDFQLNGNAVLVSSNDVRLTQAAGSVGGSMFWKTRINATRPWEAQFTYEIPNCPASPADGFAFLLHNNAAGAAGLGGVGGSIGAVGLTPSLGAAFNVYNNDTVGWIYDNAKKDMTAPITTTSLQAGADIRVTHDGQGKLTTTVYSKGADAVFRQSKMFDIYSKLGGATAYAGMTAATGGAVCEQHVKNFRFAQDDDVPNFALTTENWQNLSNAVFSTLSGEPAVRLTENVGSVAGVLTHRSRLYLERPFKISGTYVVANGTAKIADGAAFVFHNDRLESVGGIGGSRGFVGSGYANMPSCAGWSLNIWNSRVDFVKNAAVGTQHTALNGVDLQAKNTPIDFELDYAPGRFVFTAKQLAAGTEKIFCATQQVVLADLVGSSFAFFSVTAATGGSTAEQWVYNLKYEVGSEAVSTDGYAGGTFAGTSAIELSGVASGMSSSSLGDVALADGAKVTVRASGSANVPYEVTFETVRFAGGDGTAPMVNLAANGTGAGTLKLGTVVADLTGRPLKIVGTLAPSGEKIRVELPVFTGLVKVLDLTEATGVEEGDFELVTETKQPARLIMRSGALYAVHSVGTIFILR